MIERRSPYDRQGRSVALIASLLLHGVIVIALGLNITSKTGHESAPLILSLVTSIPKAEIDGGDNETDATDKVKRPALVAEVDIKQAKRQRNARVILSVPEKAQPLAREAYESLSNAIPDLVQEAPKERITPVSELEAAAVQVHTSEEVDSQHPELVTTVDHDPQSSILNPQLTSAVLAFVGDLSSLGIIVDDALVGNYVRAEAVVFPEPAYPPLSRRRGEEGRVVIKVKISAEGGVRSAEIVSGSLYTRLDRAALEAVKLVHFSPATKYGRPVDSERTVAYRFELEER